jgi:hypothetical protein
MPDMNVDEARSVIAKWLSDAQSAGASDVYESKRHHMRFTWDRPLELMAHEQLHYVYSRDISDAGIGLLCKFHLDAGEVVYVRSSEEDPWVRCRVAHATPTIGAYKVGVELIFDLAEDE